MRVTPRGRVLSINGQTNYNEGEWDALLRLPARPLRLGLTWSDTLTHPTTGPHGEGEFTVHRTYRVTRVLQSRDSTGFEVAIEGNVTFSLSMWTDSAAGRYRWFELEGPMQETFVFDPTAGQLHGRRWSMLLEGIGGDHDGVRLDTVPAGLRSENVRYRIPDARADALMAPLPGADTSITITGDGDPILLHTMGRDAAILSEGFRRPDGRVGRAEVSLAEGVPQRWTFTWVDPESDRQQFVFERAATGLLAQGARLDAPTPAWGVAEYGMTGTLVATLQTLSDTQAVPFSIYRPTAGRWDTFELSSRSLPELSLYLLTDQAGARTALIVDAKGLLMYEEFAGTDGSRRIRIPASAERQAELRRALSSLQAGD